MKKLVNFRPFFYCFLAFFGAILFAKQIFLSNWVSIVLFILIIAALTTTCLLRNKPKILLLILVFITLGIAMYLVEIASFNTPIKQKNLFVEARVSQSVTYNKKHYVVLENVVVEGEELGSNAYLTFYGAPYLNEGDNIEFYANLTPVSCFTSDGKVQSSLYKKGCKYYANKVSNTEIVVVSSSPTIAESVRSSIKQNISQNMDEENAAITYATLFGDKSEIDSEVISSFQTSGIAHILAVSGLHVGLVAGILNWILKRLKSKSYVRLVVISICLIFYCYLCSFSPSVVRATVMSICLVLADVSKQRYDSLSAIGFAGLLILLVKPLYAFDVGFQLSFGCVIGIAIFYRSVYSFLRKKVGKFVLPNFVAKPLAMSISTQFLILPVLVSYFNGVSFLSIFANIIVIPVFTLAFNVSFIASILVYISGIFGKMFWFSGLLLNVIKQIAQWISSQTWTIIPHFKFIFAAFVSFFCLMFASCRLFLVKNKTKLLTCLCLTCLTVLIIGLLQLAPSGV